MPPRWLLGEIGHRTALRRPATLGLAGMTAAVIMTGCGMSSTGPGSTVASTVVVSPPQPSLPVALVNTAATALRELDPTAGTAHGRAEKAIRSIVTGEIVGRLQRGLSQRLPQLATEIAATRGPRAPDPRLAEIVRAAVKDEPCGPPTLEALANQARVVLGPVNGTASPPEAIHALLLKAVDHFCERLRELMRELLDRAVAFSREHAAIAAVVANNVIHANARLPPRNSAAYRALEAQTLVDRALRPVIAIVRATPIRFAPETPAEPSAARGPRDSPLQDVLKNLLANERDRFDHGK